MLTKRTTIRTPRLPSAPHSIQKGISLAALLDQDAIDCLSHNISLVHPAFDGKAFQRSALSGLKPLSIMQRGHHLAKALREHLPVRYDQAVRILLKSLTPPQTSTEDLGLAVFFYLPHVSFVATYGLDPAHNDGHDPFEISMLASVRTDEALQRGIFHPTVSDSMARTYPHTSARMDQRLRSPCAAALFGRNTPATPLGDQDPSLYQKSSSGVADS